MEHRRINKKSQSYMRSQSVLADMGIIDQTAFHHIPPHRSLQAAKQENSGKLKAQRAVDRLSRKEINKGNKKGNPDDAAQQAVEIFPPENSLELTKAHTQVHLFILRCLVIFFEKLVPILVAKRRNGPDNRLPFNNRKTRVREPRYSSDNDHGKYKPTASQ